MDNRSSCDFRGERGTAPNLAYSHRHSQHVVKPIQGRYAYRKHPRSQATPRKAKLLGGRAGCEAAYRFGRHRSQRQYRAVCCYVHVHAHVHLLHVLCSSSMRVLIHTHSALGNLRLGMHCSESVGECAARARPRLGLCRLCSRHAAAAPAAGYLSHFGLSSLLRPLVSRPACRCPNRYKETLCIMMSTTSHRRSCSRPHSHTLRHQKLQPRRGSWPLRDSRPSLTPPHSTCAVRHRDRTAP